IWDRFEEISRIPRPSKGEEKIAKHIKELGENLKLKVETDEQNNVLIRVPATQGLENTPGVILQCHSDMVCVSDDENMNPSKAGVSPVISSDRKWVHAKGTTLGADNGIGVAVFLALLEEKDFKHGPLVVLVTTDEETGLNGAKN